MLKVFISSTSEDLGPYRQAAQSVVLDLGWQPIMMEHFGTNGRRTILEYCTERIEQADIILAILAWRRGWIPEPSSGGDGQKSYTAFEIEIASSRGKPIVVLMARDTWPGRLWESDHNARVWINNFRQGLDRLAVFFEWEEANPGSPEPLPIFRSKIRQELLRHQQNIFSQLDLNRSLAPEPIYRDEGIKYLSKNLEKAYKHYEELISAGQNGDAVRDEILHLRRQLREGGQLRAGDFLGNGRFKLLEKIGIGGFATVWKSYDRKRHMLVAIKVLHGQLLGRKIFTGGDVKQLMTRIRLGRVPEFSQVLPDTDPSLEEFFRYALHKTLSRRPATALEMRRRLERVREALLAKTS